MQDDISTNDDDLNISSTDFKNSDSHSDEEEFLVINPKTLLKAIKSSLLFFDNFGRDLTKMASEDKLDPIVEREKEIERVGSQILSRRKKEQSHTYWRTRRW